MTGLESHRNDGLQVLEPGEFFGYREIALQHCELSTYLVFLETLQLR